MNLKIIYQHILKSLLSPFAISLTFLTFVFLMTRIPQITNMVVNFNADISAVGLMLLFAMPRFLEFTIPMSVMIAVLLTFMRMSQDNEIVALKAAGVHLYKLLPPVLIFCIAGLLITMWVTVFGVAWGKLAIKKKSIEIARSSIDAALQERQFNSELEDIMIYVGNVDIRTKSMTDVFIEDRRTKGMVSISVAPRGQLIRFEEDQIYTIKLFDGVINQVDVKDSTVNHIRFSEYDINIDLAELNQDPMISKELDERNIVELWQFVRAKQGTKAEMGAARMELHEKFAIPFACLFLGLLAFPIGIQSASLRRSSGFGMGIFFFLFYYVLLAIGWSGGETGNYPPIIGMWLPNLIIGGVAVYFMVQNAKEKPVEPPAFVTRFLQALEKRVARKV